jgi:hypothetical protein
MALVPCPECRKEVSTEAWACPQCAFPFPGKQGAQEGRPTVKFNTCPECDVPIATHARACPHCGISFIEGPGHQKRPEEVFQETSLCPHCGSTYIRSTAQTVDPSADVPGTMSSATRRNPETTETRESRPDTYKNDPALQSSRRRSPLWQDLSITKAVSSPRYRRSKKQSIIIGLLLLVIVAVSVLFGALWQLKGLTPVEALLSWRM